MEILKKIIDRLPFPVIVALGMIACAMWIIKQNYGWENYQNVLRNPVFLGFCVFVVFSLLAFYVVRLTLRPSSSRDIREQKQDPTKARRVSATSDTGIAISIGQMQGGSIAMCGRGATSSTPKIQGRTSGWRGTLPRQLCPIFAGGIWGWDVICSKGVCQTSRLRRM